MTKGSAALVADLLAVPLDQINAEVPAALSKLVIECIESLPTRRPSSMSEVGSRLMLIARKISKDSDKEAADKAADKAADDAAKTPPKPELNNPGSPWG